MADLPMWRRYLRFLGPDVRADVEDELQFHLDMRTEDLMARGMDPEEARTEALRRMGNLPEVRRECLRIGESAQRTTDRRERLWTALQDVRRAARGLLRSPGFTLASVLTLGLGIGATTAIFSVLNAVVLTPLAYPDSERLVWIGNRVPGVGPEDVWGMSQAGYLHVRENSRTLEEVGAFTAGRFGLRAEAGTVEVEGALVTASLLELLDARPAAGRMIGARDDHPEAPRVAVLGHDFWQRAYASDPAVVGSTITVEEMPVEVVGVMAPGVSLPDRATDLWIPRRMDPARPPSNSHMEFETLGRMRDGVTPEEVRRELAGLTARFPEIFPEAYSPSFLETTGFTPEVVPLRSHVIGSIDRVLWVLFGSVALVLLIAGANVANLFLVRAEARRREEAIRSALGAGRVHLLRHALAEGLLLALLAGVLGVWLAFGGLRVLLRLAPPELPRMEEVGLGAEGILFAAAVSVVAGLALGALPLLRRPESFRVLREGGRGLSGSRRQHAARGVLVVGQVALALVLLAAAGLLLRSFQALNAVEPGIDPDRVVALDVSIPWSRYRSYDDVNRFYRELTTRVAALPGVESVGSTVRLPFRDVEGCASVFAETGPAASGEPPCVPTPLVSPGYFRAMGIPVQGREYTWQDNERHADGVVVSRALAERLWPGEDPIGKAIKANDARPPYYRVMGVAADVRSDGLDQPPLEAVYFPMLPAEGTYLWSPPRSMRVVVRTATDRPEQVIPAVQQAVQELDPGVPIGRAATMREVMRDSTARASFTLTLLAIAAGMALLLSAVGIYGVISYVVGLRRSEIGIRMALGARVEQVGRAVVAQSLRLALLGVGIGLVAALATTRALRSLLFEVSPSDPSVLIGASVLLLLLAMLASYVPARRATRVEPVEALRTD